MRHLFFLPALGLAIALASLSGTASAERLSPGLEAQGNVQTYIEHGDCAGAVKQLNEGLAHAYPEVFLLAGTMYDQGMCVKPNWQRAVHFYVRAHDGGQRAAAYRLAAGFAAPEHGPDAAAALWWAAQVKPEPLTNSACTVSKEASKDPDRFVAELKSWPAQLLAQCNYNAGMLATLMGEVNYPSRALSYDLGGEFTVIVTPATGHIEVQQGEIQEANLGGVYDGNFATDRGSRAVTSAFEGMLRDQAQRALKRYPKPEGLDPAWKIKAGFSFNIR